MTALAQTVPLRRGACPGLSAPMPTGDGLLVRLQPIGTVPLAAFAALCAAARRHGNGVIEVTSRGNIQIRGLTGASAPRFAADVAALDIAMAGGTPVLCSPLAGLDPDELVDPHALAEELRHGPARATLAARLSAKISVAIESGGALDPTDVPADIRLSGRPLGAEVVFDVAVGGDGFGAISLGAVACQEASEAVFRLLEVTARYGRDRRARDILSREGEAPFRDVLTDIVRLAHSRESGPRRNRRDPIGNHPLRDGSIAFGVGLTFGHADATILERLAEVANAAGAGGFRAAPGRALLAVGVAGAKISALAAAAEQLGFVTHAGDRRRHVIACAGAPICGSAYIAARALAPKIAGCAEFTVHVSGCAKGCAHPAPASLTVVGTPDGCALVASGSARDAPFAVVSEAELLAAIERFTRERTHEGNHV